MNRLHVKDMAPVLHPWSTAPEPGSVQEVAPDVFWIRIALPMVLDHVNCYALDDGDGWTIVDTGFDTETTRQAWEAVLSGPLGGRPVRRLIVTHHHPDHIGLAGWFRSAFGAEIWTSRTSWLYARMLSLDTQEAVVPETLAFWRAAGMEASELERRAAERPFNFADIMAPLPLGYRRMVEGDTIRAAGRDWVVRMGEGHGPEHVTLWSEDNTLVIAGDQILSGITPNIGVHATEPEANPLAEWLSACSRLAACARDSHLVLPGHKLPFTGLPRRLAEMQANHDAALERLRALLREPKTAVECFPALFRRRIDRRTLGLALVEAVAHLNYLNGLGEVQRHMRDDGVALWRLRDATGRS